MKIISLSLCLILVLYTSAVSLTIREIINTKNTQSEQKFTQWQKKHRGEELSGSASIKSSKKPWLIEKPYIVLETPYHGRGGGKVWIHLYVSKGSAKKAKKGQTIWFEGKFSGTKTSSFSSDLTIILIKGRFY